MFKKVADYITKGSVLVLLIIVTGLLTACGQDQSTEIKEYDMPESTAEEKKDTEGIAAFTSEEPALDKEAEAKAAKMKEMFGENCIAEQTFEVEMSEYDGTVYFVPFFPVEEDDPDFHIEIIQNGEVLNNLWAYVPDELIEEKFTSLDAVSFCDVNFDDYTDILLIQTYGDTSYAVVYYGFAKDADKHERYFFPEGDLSDNITKQVENLTIPEIRSFLTQDKKNGEFTSYQEAYASRSRLCEMETTSEMTYDLIYFDEDDVPELVAGVDGYSVSLYTYRDGRLYTLMDGWGYGAMGNAGYEYSPGKNSLRNYNADYAGAIMYTTYMAVSNKDSMELVAQIVTYNFDDANGNGMPDEEEEGSMGMYSVSYINDVEATSEECQAYDMGNYEYIIGHMTHEELKKTLSTKG